MLFTFSSGDRYIDPISIRRMNALFFYLTCSFRKQIIQYSITKYDMDTAFTFDQSILDGTYTGMRSRHRASHIILS